VQFLRQIWQNTWARIVKPFASQSPPSPSSQELVRKSSAAARENLALAAELQRLRVESREARTEENRKIAILEEAHQQTRAERIGEVKHLAQLAQRVAELEAERNHTFGLVSSIGASLTDASSRLDTMDNQVGILQAGVDDQARQSEASLSVAIARQDKTDGEIMALRATLQRQVESFALSLADTLTRLETTDSHVSTLEKKLDLEHRLYTHTVQEVQSQVQVQDQRLNWTMMAALVAMLLGAVAGGILIWDVQKNARVLAGVNEELKQLRSSMGSPLATQHPAAAVEPAALPDVIGKIESPAAHQPAARQVPEPKTAIPETKPASIPGRKPVNYYLIGSGFERARQEKGIRQSSRGEVVPFLKEIIGRKDAPGVKDSAVVSDNTGDLALETLQDGVQYRVVKSGNGASPASGDQVLVNYLAMTPDGTVFEETYSAAEPATLAINALEPRLQEALLKMDEGAEWEVYIPARVSPKGVNDSPETTESQQKIYLIELLKVIKGNGRKQSETR
jgi:hypothetical protein